MGPLREQAPYLNTTAGGRNLATTRPPYRLIQSSDRAIPLKPRPSYPRMDGSQAHADAFGGGPGEPGGTRAMEVCEPGQGGNAAAINNTFMCLGEPPRLSRIPAWT
jgi:hypothetical protein